MWNLILDISKIDDGYEIIQISHTLWMNVFIVYLSLCIVDIIICALSIVYFQYSNNCAPIFRCSSFVKSRCYISQLCVVRDNRRTKKNKITSKKHQTCKSTRLSGRFGQEMHAKICIVCFECLFIISSLHSLSFFTFFFFIANFFLSLDWNYNKIKSSISWIFVLIFYCSGLSISFSFGTLTI